MTKNIKLKFPVLYDNSSCFSIATIAIGSLIPLPVDKIEELRQAVIEACSIIVRDVYKTGGVEDRGISILFKMDSSSKAEVLIKDEGDVFDPQQSETSADRLLSLMIIKSLMKDVKLEDLGSDGSMLTMTKYIFSEP